MILEFVTSSSLGSLLGMRHALEPDHLAAVSTLVTGERSSAKAAWVGACWGLGHTLTLMAAGAVLVLLRVDMPAFASDVFDLCVVLLLIGFGLRAICQAARQYPTGPADVPMHSGATAHGHIGRWTAAKLRLKLPRTWAARDSASLRRALLVGAVHGLAGSGALTAVVVATLPSTAARLTYLGLFGIGSIVGMAALSGFLGWPLARLGSRRVIARALSLAIGCISTALGLFWGQPLIGRLF